MGVHGFAIANARLAGPLSRIEVPGDLNITDIHRWDLMPPKAEGWQLNYRAVLDMRSHQLEVGTVAQENQPQPVSVKFRLADYLSSPKWAASVTFRGLPATSLVETSRHMGAPFPAGVQVDGKVEGGIGYSSEGGLQGRLLLESASVKSPGAASAEFASAPVLFSRDRIAFGPADVRMENGQSAEIEGEYALDNSHAALKITTRQLTIAQVQSSAAEHVISATPIPLLEKLRQGTWKGWIAFDRRADQAGVWSGDYALQKALIGIPGLAGPWALSAAAVEMKAGVIEINRIHGHAGACKLEDDYRFHPAAGRPHRVPLSSPQL